MKLRLRKCALMLLLLALLLSSALAAQTIDLNRECRLDMNFVQGDVYLPGVQIAIYRAADVAGDGRFALTADFAKSSVSTLNGLSDEQLRQAAYALTTHADSQGLTPAKAGRADNRGYVSFTGLKPGMYLVVPDHLAQGKKVYQFEPMLVSLPGSDPNGAWNYTLTMKPKVEVQDQSTQELKVVKVWRNDSSSDRPNSITVKLLRNGKLYETVELNIANNWRHIWFALDNTARWQIVEDAVSGYTSSIQQEAQLVTIINTKIVPTTPGYGTVLPQTGLLWWPVPVLAAAGMLFFLLGWLHRRQRDK